MDVRSMCPSTLYVNRTAAVADYNIIAGIAFECIVAAAADDDVVVSPALIVSSPSSTGYAC